MNSSANSKKTWKQKAKQLKKEIFVLYLSYKDKRVPWYAKVWTAIILAYAFSPIDLIPDFIPILGYLDDLILLPLGIMLAIKLIPKDVIEEYRAEAELRMKEAKPKNYLVAGIIILVWLFSILMLVYLLKGD